MKADLSPSMAEAAWLTRGPAVLEIEEGFFDLAGKGQSLEWSQSEERAGFNYLVHVEFLRAKLGGVDHWPRGEDWQLLEMLLEYVGKASGQTRLELEGEELCFGMGWEEGEKSLRRLSESLARWLNLQFVFSVSQKRANDKTWPFQAGSGSILSGYQEMWDNRFSVSISRNLTWPLKKGGSPEIGLALLDTIHTQYNHAKWVR